MRRKIIAVLLSVAMTLSLMPAMAFASDEYTITYEQSGTGDSYCLVWIDEARYPQTLNPGSIYSVPAGAEVQVSGNRNDDPYLGNVGEVTDYNGRERCLAAANGQDAPAIMKETDEMITHV